MTALHDLPGTRLLALFARRELSPSEYYEHLLAHIQRWEPHLNALYRFDPQRIREQAAAATERWRKGQPKGPLDGLPVTIKELIATAGEPIPLGSAAALQPAPCDAPPAARLREAGAIVLAKTTVPDFGMLSSGLSSFHGVTRNPWNLANNTGGSSSGAAAGRRRLRTAAPGHRHRRLGATAGGLVRPGGLQAKPRADPHRPLLHRSLRRSDDPLHGRLPAADALPRAARRPRRHQPAAGSAGLERRAAVGARPEGRPATRPRLRPAARRGNPRRDRPQRSCSRSTAPSSGSSNR